MSQTMLELVTSSPAPRVETLAQSEQRTLSAWPVVACVVLPLLRLGGLTHQSLWYDEGYTLTLASASSFSAFLKAFFGLTTSEHVQPLYYFLMFLWSRLAGTSDFALRLPSALFSIASGVIVYDLCLHLPRVRRSFAVIACGAISISSFSVYYAQEARPYALLQMLSFALLSLWIRGKVGPGAPQGRLAKFGLAAVCGLCVLGSAFTALLVLALSAADLLSERQISPWVRKWRAPFLFAAACIVAYLWTAVGHLDALVAKDVTSIKQPLWMNMGYTLYGVLFGTTLGPSNAALRDHAKLHVVLSYSLVLGICALVLLALSVGVARVLRKSSRDVPGTRSVAIATALYAALFFGGFGVVGGLNILPRHASALFALVATLVLLSASSVWAANRPLRNEWLAAGLAGWLAMNLLSIYGYRMAPEFQKDDYRAMARVIAGNDSLPVFMVAGQPNLMEHYGAPVLDATQIDPQNLAQYLRTSSGDAREIKIVMNEHRGFRWDNSAGPSEVLATDYQCVQERHLAFMQLLVCHLNSPGAPQSSFAPRRTVSGRTNGE